MRPQATFHLAHDSFQIVAKLTSDVVARTGCGDYVDAPLTPPGIEF